MFSQLPASVRAALIVAVAIWFTHRPLIEMSVDWMWFDAAGYLDVFKTSLTARVALFATGFVAAAIFLRLNIRHALASHPIQPNAFRLVSGELMIDPNRVAGLLGLLGWVVTLLPALVFGLIASSLWVFMRAFTDCFVWLSMKYQVIRPKVS